MNENKTKIASRLQFKGGEDGQGLRKGIVEWETKRPSELQFIPAEFC